MSRSILVAGVEAKVQTDSAWFDPGWVRTLCLRPCDDKFPLASGVRSVACETVLVPANEERPPRQETITELRQFVLWEFG